jgi:hypothetical protein
VKSGTSGAALFYLLLTFKIIWNLQHI